MFHVTQHLGSSTPRRGKDNGTADYTGHQCRARTKIRVRATYLPALVDGYCGQDGARTITFLPLIFLIITLLSNSLLQYVESNLGLGLSPSRQTVIRYNDSTGIRCYVRPYSPRYAPSLVLSNISNTRRRRSSPAVRLAPLRRLELFSTTHFRSPQVPNFYEASKR